MTFPELLWGLILISALAMLSWIDVRTLRLPDALTLPLIAVGVLQSWYFSGRIQDALIGAVAGYLFFVLVETAFRHLRGKEGLGRGDAKLLAAGGAWCGWIGLPWIVLLASSSGLLFAGVLAILAHRFPRILPFGPFLAFGIGAVWCGPVLLGLA